MRRFFNRRTLTITAISLLALIAILALAAFLWIRSANFNNWVAGQFKTALAEYRIRVEIGAIKPGFRDLTIELKDVKFFAQDEKEPFASLDQLNGNFKFRDLLTRNVPTEVSLQNLKIDGLKFWYKLDANGVSNLSKLDFTKKGKEVREDLEFDYAAANVVAGLRKRTLGKLGCPRPLAGKELDHFDHDPMSPLATLSLHFLCRRQRRNAQGRTGGRHDPCFHLPSPC